MLTLSRWMRRLRHRGEDGIVGANLAVTLAFALYAVIQLTRTTLAAKQIDDRVDVIFNEVTPIDQELDEVKRLDDTVRIAAEIDQAAKPLSAQAGEIITTARSIDNTVSSILSTAGQINGTVRSINGEANGILATVRAINQGVADINTRAIRGIDLVAGIRGDLHNVLAQVGTAGPAGHGNAASRTIHGHANSIDCKVLGAGACEPGT